MLGENRIKAFVPTINPDEAKEFYQNILGLKLISEDNFAIEFEGKGTQLRITTVNSFEPHPFAVLGWNVSDLATLIKRMNELGVEFERYVSLDQDQLGIWTSPGRAKIGWFKDPDGNLLSLTEMPK